MGRTSYKYAGLLTIFLVSLALIGAQVIEFMFVTVITIGVGAVLFYAFMGFLYGVDRILDWLYTAR